MWFGIKAYVHGSFWGEIYYDGNFIVSHNFTISQYNRAMFNKVGAVTNISDKIENRGWQHEVYHKEKELVEGRKRECVSG